MGCCCSNTFHVTIKKQAIYSVVVNWADNNNCSGSSQRQLQWRFSRNGIFVHATPFAAPTAPLAIGTASTYQYLNATPADITAYLISVGIPVVAGDKIALQVRVKNCRGANVNSNFLYVIAVDTQTCDCAYSAAFDTGQSGNTATLPGTFTAPQGLLVFQDGGLNYPGLDFTSNPLLAQDELMFLTIGGCTATLDQVTVLNQTGTVTAPPAFAALAPNEFLLFRNRIMQRGYSMVSGNITPNGSIADLSDEWHFVRINGSLNGCTFGSILVGTAVSGLTFNAPSGFNASNQDKWLLVINGITMYLGSGSVWGYTVNGAGLITLTTPAINDEVWIVPIL